MKVSSSYKRSAFVNVRKHGFEPRLTNLVSSWCPSRLSPNNCSLGGVVNPQIPQVVRKEAAEQKLHGKIVEPFGAMPLIPILSCEGGLTEFFAHAQGHRLEHVEG